MHDTWQAGAHHPLPAVLIYQLVEAGGCILHDVHDEEHPLGPHERAHRAASVVAAVAQGPAIAHARASCSSPTVFSSWTGHAAVRGPHCYIMRCILENVTPCAAPSQYLITHSVDPVLV
jgi:hypothetical protein